MRKLIQVSSCKSGIYQSIGVELTLAIGTHRWSTNQLDLRLQRGYFSDYGALNSGFQSMKMLTVGCLC
jgi:hypothetical protein